MDTGRRRRNVEVNITWDGSAYKVSNPENEEGVDGAHARRRLIRSREASLTFHNKTGGKIGVEMRFTNEHLILFRYLRRWSKPPMSNAGIIRLEISDGESDRVEFKAFKAPQGTDVRYALFVQNHDNTVETEVDPVLRIDNGRSILDLILLLGFPLGMLVAYLIGLL